MLPQTYIHRRHRPAACRPGYPFPGQPANGPDHITKYAPYSSYTGDRCHRFFQMWQDLDGGRHESSSGWRRRSAPARTAPPRLGGFNPKEGAISMGF